MQTPSVALNIGADVGKDEVVMACVEGSFATRKIHNQRAALLAFLKDLPAGSRIGMESTGIYHELLAELAHKRGLVVYVLNPKDTRHYAKAMGLRGKTDRVDAELIARMIAHEHAKLHPWLPAHRRAAPDRPPAQTARQGQPHPGHPHPVVQGREGICCRDQCR